MGQTDSDGPLRKDMRKRDLADGAHEYLHEPERHGFEQARLVPNLYCDGVKHRTRSTDGFELHPLQDAFREKLNM